MKFKKGIEMIKSQKPFKKYGDEMEFYRTKVNSIAFAIPILIIIISNLMKANAVRIEIANALELTFVL